MKTKDMTLIAVFTAGLCVLSLLPKIPVPFSPVPITMQTLGILLAPIVLGFKRGTIAVCLYIGLGAIGLPVFAGGEAGVGILAGPTGGYIIGFIPAAAIIGIATDKFGFWGSCAGSAIATIVIYVIGTVQLANVLNLGMDAAIKAAVIPFIPGDIIKAVLAVLLGTKLREILNKTRAANAN